MKVRNALAIVCVVAFGSAMTPIGFAIEGGAPQELPTGKAKPPKHLKQAPDGHWTAWDPPPVAEGQKVHVVVAGDTLWDLSAHTLTNPYLWPQIWDQNRYVLDSHWIYPGDPVVLPDVQVVPPTAGAATGTPTASPTSAENESDEGVEGIDAGESAAAPSAPAAAMRAPTRYDVSTQRDLRCAATIEDQPAKEHMAIVGLENPELVSVGPGDVVYIDAGASNGIAPGDRFTILRNGSKVKHPVSNKMLGHRVDMVGELSVIAVASKGATAEVTFSCENIVRGDLLAPLVRYDKITSDAPAAQTIDVYNPRGSGKKSGYLVMSRDPQYALADGNLVDIDLGSRQGVKPGDVMAIYRPNPEGRDLPRVNLGLGVVMITRDHSSVMKISTTVREMFLGDRVEMR